MKTPVPESLFNKVTAHLFYWTSLEDCFCILKNIRVQTIFCLAKLADETIYWNIKKIFRSNKNQMTKVKQNMIFKGHMRSLSSAWKEQDIKIFNFYESRKIILLFLEMRVTKKVFIRAATKKFFYQFNWIF